MQSKVPPIGEKKANAMHVLKSEEESEHYASYESN
jgi:hypothetical protein